jgi:alanine dehydrogenase
MGGCTGVQPARVVVLGASLNTVQGSVCHPGVAKALGVPPRHPMACLS